MDELATELKAGKVDHTQPPTDYSDGKRVRSFEFLNLHMPQIKNLKLSMTNSQGQSVASVDLKRQSDLRPSQLLLACLLGVG